MYSTHFFLNITNSCSVMCCLVHYLYGDRGLCSRRCYNTYYDFIFFSFLMVQVHALAILEALQCYPLRQGKHIGGGQGKKNDKGMQLLYSLLTLIYKLAVGEGVLCVV